MADFAKIGPVPKGNYSASTAYKVLDVVHYQNAMYIAKTNTQGNAPTNTTYWMLCAQGVTVSNSAAVTTAGIALDARQANPAVPNSLGAQIATLNGKLTNAYESFVLPASEQITKTLINKRVYMVLTSRMTELFIISLNVDTTCAPQVFTLHTGNGITITPSSDSTIAIQAGSANIRVIILMLNVAAG